MLSSRPWGRKGTLLRTPHSTPCASWRVRIPIIGYRRVAGFGFPVSNTQQSTMVEISIKPDSLVVTVLGWSRLWSLKNRLEAPLRCVRAVRRDGDLPGGFWLRWPGTHLPGVIKAGSYWDGSRWSFWDVRRRRDNVLVIELSGWEYDYIVAEVNNPALVVTQINAAIAKPPE